MPDIYKQTLDTIKIIILAAILVVGIQYVFAWGPPAGSIPPECQSGQPGCDTPVNASRNAQMKEGALVVGTFTDGSGIDFSVGSAATGNLNFFVKGGGAAYIKDSLSIGSDFSGSLSTGELKTSAEITGNSFSLSSGSGGIDSTGAVTAGRGTFTGGITIGTASGDSYLQIDSAETKPNGACAISDIGKLILYRPLDRIYICKGDSMWGYIAIAGEGSGF